MKDDLVFRLKKLQPPADWVYGYSKEEIFEVGDFNGTMFVYDDESLLNKDYLFLLELYSDLLEVLYLEKREEANKLDKKLNYALSLKYNMKNVVFATNNDIGKSLMDIYLQKCKILF